ncbi:hypothetical protein Tco_1030314 [Tanacetum coccineum]|uniref:No apical meristem-associated C-terminal domain-containing protein n=1 Tax=Tanacetum coccineum TaxID=301880 RepID=A0ABQ5G732_9ASTR
MEASYKSLMSTRLGLRDQCCRHALSTSSGPSVCAIRTLSYNAGYGNAHPDVMPTWRAQDAWDLLRKFSKWDAPPPALVDLNEDEEILAVNTDELFGPDARPRPPGKQRPGKKTKSDTSVSTEGSSSSSQFDDIMTKELRLKREAAEAAFEVAKEKDRTVIRLEEMKFLAISTKDLPEDDAYFIEEQKESIRAKYNLYRNRGSNPRGSR